VAYCIFLPQRCLVKCQVLDHPCDDTQPLPIVDILLRHLEPRGLVVDYEYRSQEASHPTPGKTGSPRSLLSSKRYDDVRWWQTLNVHQMPLITRIFPMNELVVRVGEWIPTPVSVFWPPSLIFARTSYSSGSFVYSMFRLYIYEELPRFCF
jgi:hypothetical protein